MSRPTSRTSMNPATSNLAASTTTVPFTPRIPKVRETQGIRRGVELTGKDWEGIVQSVASVRKVQPNRNRAELENDSFEDAALNNSFHPADTSFQTRPLKSRVSSSTVTSSSAALHARRVSGLATGAGVADRVGSGEERRREKGKERERGSRGVEGTDKDRGALRIPSSTTTIASGTTQSRQPSSSSSSAGAAYKTRSPRLPDDGQEEEDDLSMTTDSDDLGADSTVRALEKKPIRERKLVGVPLVVQEAWVCEDLGYVLRGVAGDIIRYDETYDPLDESHTIKGAKWQVDTSLDSSLLNVVQRLLPMATYYVAINAFVDSRHQTEWGMVNHALASGIRGILREYHLLTTRLESLYLTSPNFTLQKAFYHLHPTSNTLSMLYSLCLSLEYEEDDDLSDEDDEDSDDMMGGMMNDLGIPGLIDEKMAERGKGKDEKGNITGGEVLGVIIERGACMSGNPTAALLYSTLLLHSSQPYARMLLRWIYTGNLQDPFKEFMVKENPRMNKAGLATDFNDEYWERRYTLRDGSSLSQERKGTFILPGLTSAIPNVRPGTDRFPGGACIPPFLEPWKHKILLAGKYLNVIRECGLEVASSKEEDGREGEEGEELVDGLVKKEAEEEQLIKMNDVKFYRRIDDAYLHANKTLLNLMLHDQDLISHLRSMKHFFFLDQSEFLNQFLDNASSELRKPTTSASVSKFQSLMYLAVSNPASASSLDPRKEDLRIVMKRDSVYEYLMRIVSREAGHLDLMGGGGGGGGEKKDEKKKEQLAFEAISLDIEVRFPLSLVISRKSIDRYQILFRFLFSLHYLHLLLTNMWADHKSLIWRRRLSNAPDIEKWKRKIFNLRAQMLQWVQHVLGFATTDVLEQSWRKLEGKLGRVGTVDQLLQDHTDYLEMCMKGCMLTEKKLLDVLMRIVSTITSFVGHQASFTRTLEKYLADRNGESTQAKIAARWNVLDKFHQHWSHNNSTLFDIMSYMAGSEDSTLYALTARMQEMSKASEMYKAEMS